MLGAHRDTGQPADTGHPEAHWAGADPEKTAELSREDGGAEAMLRLQQQVAGLREQLRGQEARWSAALRDLQAQLDALKQNPGLRDGRRPSELRGPEARRSAASPQPRRHSDMQPVSVTIERVDSGRVVSCEDGGKTVSISLPVTRAASAGTGLRSEETPAPAEDAEAVHPPGRLPKSRGRKSAGPAAYGVQCMEGVPAARDSDARSPASRRPAGELLAPAPTDELTCPSADPQNLPTKAASSPNTPRPLGPGTEKEGKEEAWSPDGKVDETRSADREAVTSSKGTEKDTGAKATVLRFLNGDVKKVFPDQRVAYYLHANARTTRTTRPSGLQVVRFPNKRTEKFHPDGSKEILFPDGTVKRLSDGHEETVFPDGTSVRVDRNGDKTIVFSNGQRDIHTAQFKRREFPDGTIKTVYCNGRQETKYASGRVKIRDETGNIVRDQK